MADLDPAVRRLVDQAIEQGLPEFVEDPDAIAKVAAIVGRSLLREDAA